MNSLNNNSLKNFLGSLSAILFGGVVVGWIEHIFSQEMSPAEIFEEIVPIIGVLAAVNAYSWYCEQKGNRAGWGKLIVLMIAVIYFDLIDRGFSHIIIL
ncbi:hypothetical protein DSCO28_01740 [Desulfosarcina ovata subsp. sediminis]|uniref:Uncharacterized protein n=1 Tax=Desulfosarcina ovata subsp. sediminis TaxID=885957 RepID=A0A5K7ZBR8_9BACT|nr:hypothetical protein [Desulfosarcina ovata]BBO79608.1 hypothetical protein DSCO28_01740 [Desulfosarcina ovata subsp. sediminis]